MSQRRLTASQCRRAEKLADQHTKETVNPLFKDATGIELDVLGWALYLIGERTNRAAGITTPGYTGRKSNRR